MNSQRTSVVPLLAVALLASCLFAQERIPLDGVWQIRRHDQPDEAFRPISVPGAFESVLGHDFDGIARYRRKLPAFERVRKVFVEFDAVATHAEVFLNGKRVGTHLGGWTPFRVELTRHLHWDGDNVLDVVVDERVGHNTQGFLPVIQPHFGGIWQSVTLCLNDAPTIDRQRLFVFGNGQGDVTVRSPIVDTRDRRQRVDGLRIDVFDGRKRVASQTRTELARFAEPLRIERVKLWSNENPHRYRAEIALTANGREVDRVVRHFGCRSLHADGTRVLWNGSPFQMRGILHWGFSPPFLAPPTDPAHWRPQLEHFQSLGFNTIKCCLWVPPTSFYDLCDELGMLVWQEYPTWHAKLDQHHKGELLREYREFFAHDRSHPSVAFRSITCETGHGADLDVVQSLFVACKAAVPDTLVVDDSSWIGWQRVTDFWDEHPYGNNSWLPSRIGEFEQHIAKHGAKPLLLGECIAADTWVDTAAWLQRYGTLDTWWRPWCWVEQQGVESWLRDRFGSDLLAHLEPWARAFALRNRQFQIERLRLQMPNAGYVVSVARDFPKARMGFYDDLDRPKFTPQQWQWHRDTMLCLDRDWHQRSIAPRGEDVGVVVSHFGASALTGRLRVWSDDLGVSIEQAIELQPGHNAAPVALRLPNELTRTDRLHRVRLYAELTGDVAARNHWDLWLVPPQPAGPLLDFEVVDHLTPELLDRIAAGAKVLLTCSDRSGSVKNDGIWTLKGAPFAPDHPIHERLPRDALLELSSFDLERARVVPWAGWRNQIDPILGFWDTHDSRDVRMWLMAFETRLGKGRLLVSALRHEGPVGQVPSHVMQRLGEHLVNGPPPQRALSDVTVAALRSKLGERTIELPTWRFRTDPEDVGRTDKWSDPTTDVTGADWRDLQAGSHWENQGEDLAHYTGVAWYRVDVDVPADWRGLAARAVFDGVDDSFDVWLNGEHLGTFGDEQNKVTIWLERQVQELGRKLRPGEQNTLVLRVVDHAGAGGLWKGVRLTTGPVGAAAELLR